MGEEMEFIEDPRHREPTCEEMAWALARIKALEDVVRELHGLHSCIHQTKDGLAYCNTCTKAIELVNQGGK